MDYKPLPFGIEYVVDLDLPDIKKVRAKDSFDIDCPFCAGKAKRKLNINTSNGFFRCNKCGESGNAISLHAKLTGLSNKEAYKDLINRWNGLSSDQKVKLVVKQNDPNKMETIPAPVLLRSVAYEKLLELLTLSDTHKKNLIDRGLSPEAIEHFGYKSYPAVGLAHYAKKVNELTGIDSSLSQNKARDLKDNEYYQIPGFYHFGFKTRLVKRKPCFFVPVRNIHGQITRMQIRYDNLPDDATEQQREEFKRYASWASTEREDGVSVTGTENVHWVGFDKPEFMKMSEYKTPEIVGLTEGALKADIAYYFSKMPFISLMGVNSQGQLSDALKFLKEHGTKRINLCFDMDYRDKKEVAAAMESAKKKITEAGLEYLVVKWDEKYGKGIDDFLLSKAKIKNQKGFDNYLMSKLPKVEM